MLSASKSGSASGASGYNLTRSLRFRRSAGGYLNRTAGAGNQQIMTLSFWFKRGLLGVAQYIFGSYSSGSAYTNIYIESTDQIGLADAASGANLLSTQVFRDPSAWYHIVVAIDTTQATAANRVRFYVNNVQITAFASSTYPAQNTNLNLNSAVNHTLFNNAAPSATNYTDGYLAETNFINALQLTPTSFGSTNALTGVWQPAKYTGTYGTNGFYLPFTDNSALTTSSNVGLGKDFSGNGNYWTTNNISLTAGVTYDSMTDVPTLTSATAANFATLNPLQLPSATLSNGNMTASGGGAFSISTIGMSSGKFYAEMTVTTVGGESSCGISQGGYTTQAGSAVGTTLNGGATAYGYLNDGSKFSNGVNPAYGSSYTSGDVIGIAFDATAGTLTFYKNNVSQGSAYTGLTSGPYFFAVEGRAAGGTNNCTINFGQQPFTYTPPTGYVALNTYNLPTSTIVKGNTVMDATLYSGNLIGQTITNAATFKPDLVWVKSRSAATDNKLTDSVRGATLALVSNSTAAETTDVTGVVSFNSNGFTLGTSTTYNNTGATYVGWQWQAGQGSTSSNTNGTITSTVSVNASAGFSVVTFTMPSSGVSTIGHGLGVAPSLIILKSRANTSAWVTYHASVGNGGYLQLNGTASTTTDANAFNNTSPTSSVFTVGTSFNGLSGTYLAYCWTPIAGFSAFGSYTGNGSADGPFVYTGFRPRWIMAKQSSASGQSWNIFDTARNTFNLANTTLYANQSSAEDSVSNAYDILSNGFKLRTSASQGNTNGATYVYMAFAENPFKNSLGF